MTNPSTLQKERVKSSAGDAKKRHNEQQNKVGAQRKLQSLQPPEQHILVSEQRLLD